MVKSRMFTITANNNILQFDVIVEEANTVQLLYEIQQLERDLNAGGLA